VLDGETKGNNHTKVSVKPNGNAIEVLNIDAGEAIDCNSRKYKKMLLDKKQ